jgi:GNAT superfamily N-acetyltransferase
MIRALQPYEVGLCVEGGKLFFKEGDLPGGFDAKHFCATWAQLITDKRAAILAGFTDANVITGALGAVLAPGLFNAKTYATEAFWYVIPGYRGHGVELLLAFQEWAKNAGAHYVAMIHLLNLQPEHLSRLYRKMGYNPIETNYLKPLT